MKEGIGVITDLTYILKACNRKLVFLKSILFFLSKIE